MFGWKLLLFSGFMYPYNRVLFSSCITANFNWVKCVSQIDVIILIYYNCYYINDGWFSVLKINRTIYFIILPERSFTIRNTLVKEVCFYLINGGSYVIYKSVLIIKWSADFNARFHLFTWRSILCQLTFVNAIQIYNNI